VLGGDGERERYDVELEVDIAEMREQDERDPRLRVRPLEPKLTCLAGQGRGSRARDACKGCVRRSGLCRPSVVVTDEA
jgi:hypothetical protein